MMGAVVTINEKPGKKSICDEENLFKEYLQAILSGRSGTIDREKGGAYAIQADIMVVEHRARFPK